MSQTFPKDWPVRYHNPARLYPNVWQAGPVSTTLGDCGNSTQGQQLGGIDDLGACPQTASVYVEDNSIPTWVWLIAAAWGALMLLKKR